MSRRGSPVILQKHMKTPSRNRSATKPISRLWSVQHILVPIDFSARSIRSITTANQLAQRFGATVHLAHVHGYFYPAGFFAPGAPIPMSPVTYLEDAQKLAEQRLKDLAKKYRVTGTCHARIGGPVFDEICWVAREISADLIVTSTHGHTGLKRALLGSTAERLIQHSPCPVFVARKRSTKHSQPGESKPGSTGAIDTIVVPVDFSACSLAGLKYAVQFAEKFAAKILVFHVVDLGPLITADGYAMYDLSASTERIVQEAERRMREFVNAVKFGRVTHDTAVAAGGRVDGICTVARLQKADLIISATHGWTGFKHALIGSTAEGVVRHAPCAVLVVPSHPETRRDNLEQRLVAVRETRKRSQSNRSRKTLADAAATPRSRRIAKHALSAPILNRARNQLRSASTKSTGSQR